MRVRCLGPNARCIARRADLCYREAGPEVAVGQVGRQPLAVPSHACRAALPLHWPRCVDDFISADREGSAAEAKDVFSRLAAFQAPALGSSCLVALCMLQARRLSSGQRGGCPRQADPWEPPGCPWRERQHRQCGCALQTGSSKGLEVVQTDTGVSSSRGAACWRRVKTRRSPSVGLPTYVSKARPRNAAPNLQVGACGRM